MLSISISVVHLSTLLCHTFTLQIDLPTSQLTLRTTCAQSSQHMLDSESDMNVAIFELFSRGDQPVDNCKPPRTWPNESTFTLQTGPAQNAPRIEKCGKFCFKNLLNEACTGDTARGAIPLEVPPQNM